MNEIEIYKCHLFVTLMMYYNSSKRKFEKKGKENIMEILRVEDLVKTYGKGENQVNAVDHISFSIDKGEFVAIVGASGSGKSTLLHLLGGVTINPSSMQKDNTIEFRGANSSDKAIIWQNNVNAVTKLMLAASKDLIDEEKLDYRLVEEPASSNNFFNSLELIDTIFDNNLDKIYFLKQYTKTFNFQPAKKLVKRI